MLMSTLLKISGTNILVEVTRYSIYSGKFINRTGLNKFKTSKIILKNQIKKDSLHKF